MVGRDQAGEDFGRQGSGREGSGREDFGREGSGREDFGREGSGREGSGRMILAGRVQTGWEVRRQNILNSLTKELNHSVNFSWFS